jgi:uncharacterized membrane protein YwaF
MGLEETTYVAGAGFIAGLVVLFIDLMFVRNAVRFRRMLAAGLLLVGSSIGLGLWLVTTCCRGEY